MHLHNCRYFQEHLRMLLQSLRANSLAPVGSWSVWKNLDALVRLPGVSGRIACGFRTELHFADGVSSNLHDSGLKVDVQTYLITPCICMSNLAQSQPLSVSVSSVNHHFRVNLELFRGTACSHCPDIPSSANCILVSGRLQECRRECGV